MLTLAKRLAALMVMLLGAMAAASCLAGSVGTSPVAAVSNPGPLSLLAVSATPTDTRAGPAAALSTPTATLVATSDAPSATATPPAGIDLSWGRRSPTRPPVTLTRPRSTPVPATPAPAPTASAPVGQSPTWEPPVAPAGSAIPVHPAGPPTATPDPGPTAVRVNPPDYTVDGQPIAYLTFDDGPYGKYTPRVLEILAEHRAQATFFMLGVSVERYPDLAREVAAAGHSVQNHSYHHAGLSAVDRETYLADLRSAQVALTEVSGVAPFCVRPPGGAGDTATRHVIYDLGLQVALWDVDPQDWRRPGTEVIVERVLEGIRPGAIVVLHDGGGDRSQTVDALGDILTSLTERGYVFRGLTPG